MNMNKMMIYLSDNQSIVDYMKETIENKLSRKYKMKHLAKDMGVSYAMLHRFLNDKAVGQKFFVQYFKFFCTKS